ncbi:glycosyltransferase family 2 protein [bacterium AH-315-M05]|nr:glycosyltransferase family 2 protein [bacterium AH-315-M05]
MAENDEIVNNPPLVTIGVMAYNEEKYLAETLESILQQKFSDHEIIIGDNASEDNTSNIAGEFTQKYSQIHYIRRPNNIGALQNFNCLVKAAKGKYFVLAGAHDLWSKNYLAALVEALEKNPDAVLSYAPTVWIDETGKPINKHSNSIDTSGYSTVKRFRMVMRGNQNAMYGLYRLSALLKTRLQLEIIGSGAVNLGELAILGSFIVVHDATWFRRMVRKPETKEERIQRYGRILYSKQKSQVLAHWKIPLAYFTAVLRANVSFSNRLLLMLSVPSSFIIFSHLLVYDLVRPFYLGVLGVKRLFAK